MLQRKICLLLRSLSVRLHKTTVIPLNAIILLNIRIVWRCTGYSDAEICQTFNSHFCCDETATEAFREPSLANFSFRAYILIII